MRPVALHISPLSHIGLIVPGADLAQIVLASLKRSGDELLSNDILVFAQKVVSKAEGRVVQLATVTPSNRAIELSQLTAKDPRIVELILNESKEVVRHREGVLIVEHRLGLVLANAGIDRSNVDGVDCALLLPVDPDASASRIRNDLKRETGIDVAVVIIDSIGRAWRLGTAGTAIGVSGILALSDLRGRPDLFGRPLETTEVASADELAAAASLVMGQADEGTPVVLVRGAPIARAEGSARDLVRPKRMDLFR
ncbi:MAG: coenzyme F420-0:L-glutamate ligase [Afipia sp.]|nr:coenzyme F420-0:L-glutamate ligase [Afipia sp.]